MIARFLRLFFRYFYHQFAWTYDTVAALVSLGRWTRWVRAVVPFLEGVDILEIGFGPGHLQAHLLAHTQLRVSGLDESRQMAALARSRLRRQGLGLVSLMRGRAQQLPLASASYDTVVSTFPSEYIFESATVREVYRVLRRGGRLVVLPAAWIIGKSLTDRGAAWLFKVTHHAPPTPREVLTARLDRTLADAGFEPEFTTVEYLSSVVFIINARKVGGRPKPGQDPGQRPARGYGEGAGSRDRLEP